MTEKKVYLCALDLEISVPPCVHFHDDGYVKDIREHMDFLNWRYSGQFLEDPQKIKERTQGLMAAFGSSYRGYCFHIFYLENSSFYVRGHEETHFLHAVKRLNHLEEAIRHKQGVEIDFDNLRKSIDEKERKLELIAELGGIFAQANRIGLESISRYYASSLPRSAYFKEAWFIYLNARKNSFKKSR